MLCSLSPLSKNITIFFFSSFVKTTSHFPFIYASTCIPPILKTAKPPTTNTHTHPPLPSLEREMENSNWSLFNSNSSSCTSGTRGQNSHCSNLAWDIWDLGTSRYDWSATNTTNTHYPFHHAISAAATPTAATTATYPDESAAHALMLNHQQGTTTVSVYGGAGGSHYQPDPHLMCLKLGKRHYFEDTASLQGERHVDEGVCVAKRGRSPYYGYGGGIDVVGPSTSAGAVTVASAVAVPRCQVEGCHVALVEAKEYHRRHKVCEMHAKAPKVVVLGLDQRFCQQCSR